MYINNIEYNGSYKCTRVSLLDKFSSAVPGRLMLKREQTNKETENKQQTNGQQTYIYRYIYIFIYFIFILNIHAEANQLVKT